MKNMIISIVVALAAIVAPVNAGTPSVVPPTPVEDTSFGVTAKAFASVVLDNSDEAVGGGVSLEVPVYGNLKAELVGSVLEDEVYSLGGNLLYYVPVYKNVSVYALAGGAYEFETDQWGVKTGGGVSLALSPTVNVFADAAYVFTVEDSETDGVVSIRAGVGFKF